MLTLRVAGPRAAGARTSSRTSTPRARPSATALGKMIVVPTNTFGSAYVVDAGAASTATSSAPAAAEPMLDAGFERPLPLRLDVGAAARRRPRRHRRTATAPAPPATTPAAGTPAAAAGRSGSARRAASSAATPRAWRRPTPRAPLLSRQQQRACDRSARPRRASARAPPATCPARTPSTASVDASPVETRTGRSGSKASAASLRPASSAASSSRHSEAEASRPRRRLLDLDAALTRDGASTGA